MKKYITYLGFLLALIFTSCKTSDGSSEAITENTSEENEEVNTEFQFNRIPEAEKTAIENGGTLQLLSYTTEDAAGNKLEKEAYVYVPAGYDDSEKYDIAYVMHGGGGDISILIGTPENPTSLKNAIDHQIENGDLEPMLLVFPSFYPNGPDGVGMDQVGELTYQFQTELKNGLIPAVESNYSTYANSTSATDLAASRDHRLFTGFSMGSVTTWYAFAENLDYFKYFAPVSGDCWALQMMGGARQPDETANYLADAVEQQNYSAEDFYVFAVTGTEDIAYENLSPQIASMRNLEVFNYGLDREENNLYYLEIEDAVHTNEWYFEYVYNFLPFFFGK
ncbi:enterochelin esterase [Zunongwangia sp. SCSIO 43204]|uniref:alpha/beta hydrolase n=1 Tax=Zunongwangia sp. SCSIO 43204 TaxID=2779359 RepID=UPI001CA7EA63|nr:alpha/beta hydrolase-fold protein [Zunongwangia sp. SCSIO 43204]UAB82706.1 enterochelin esterase [Zunongwangia sp. SCSIO 43204]